jgi:DNA-binding transcriptional LysR family regulator
LFECGAAAEQARALTRDPVKDHGNSDPNACACRRSVTISTHVIAGSHRPGPGRATVPVPYDERMTASFDFDRTLRRLRMRHLELLVLLGEERTVRAAARRMALTQPALSKMLHEIEDCFGAPLFGRSRSGVLPTPAGEYLIVLATAWINQLRNAGQDVAQLRDGSDASVRVGTLSVIPRVPRAIAALRRQDPGVIVRVREGTLVALLAALADGEIDCVVGALPPEALQTGPVESIRVEPLDHDALCVMASPVHALAGTRALSWSDLIGQPWVLPPKDSLLRRAIIDAHLHAGLPLPAPSVELLSPISVAELLTQDSSLLGVMRREQAEAEHASGHLQRLAVSPEVPLPALAFITLRRNEPLPPMLAAFRATLVEAAALASPAPRGMLSTSSG